MKRYVIAIIVIALTLVGTQPCFSQAKRKKKKNASAVGYNQSQWWVGIKGGATLAKANPTGEAQSIFSYTSGVADNQGTTFNSFSKPGLMLGAVISYEFIDNFSLLFAPAITTNIYKYESNYTWNSSESPEVGVFINNKFTTKLQYIEFPLLFRYEIGSNNTKPFLQLGGYYGLLTNATKEVETTNIDRASGADTQINSGKSSSGAKSNFLKSNLGMTFGGGVSTFLGNSRLVFEANYNLGMTNIVDEKARYEDSFLSTGAYDINQNLKLDQLQFSIAIFIPMKFITSRDFKPL